MVKESKFQIQKILTYSLIAIFIIRLFSYQSNIINYIGLGSTPFPKLISLTSSIVIWLNYTAILLVCLKSFFSFKVLDNISKYLLLPIFIVSLIDIYPVIYLLSGNFSFSLLLICYILECIIGIVLSIINIRNDRSFVKNTKKDIFKFIVIFLCFMLASLPGYFVQFNFGLSKALFEAKELGPVHRLLLYGAILIPFALYFNLRNQEDNVIRFALIYISLATLVGFLVNYNYTNLLEPWSWPFHLCNTAMFIVPLCLIFRMKRLFYFTYFINVFGALLAMLTPNYDSGTNILSLRIFTFWYNHWCAFFMPLLLVALKQFERPKLKQFIWSMVWFFIYFVLVLILNVVFTALGHDVNYFFLNTNWLAEKLGVWAEKIFAIKASFNIGGLKLEFHPAYQLAFFAVYVLLGLCVWFVYAELFRIADDHFKLKAKLKDIVNYDEFVKNNLLTKERREQMIKENYEAKLLLDKFSKKYATSKKFAVEEASLEVHAGEIFGFLGPNGAGKSTIIKSIVGIQPITSGTISICGFDVKADPVCAKALIGYVPDHYALYEKLTGREYINYIADIYEVSKEERDERIERYIKLFELTSSIDSKIKTYSHGMKQKITIISALVHNPKVWILDEPLTGLDPNSIYQVKECMKEHASKGNIVFFSSHLIDIVEKLCGRIAIIKHGHIECVKTVSEIESSNTTLEQFYLNIIGDNDETA